MPGVTGVGGSAMGERGVKSSRGTITEVAPSMSNLRILIFKSVGLFIFFILGSDGGEGGSGLAGLSCGSNFIPRSSSTVSVLTCTIASRGWLLLGEDMLVRRRRGGD